MRVLTVKELKEKLSLVSDDTVVCMERVEDVYFNKHGWETKRNIFGGNESNPYDYTDYFEAFSATYIQKENKFIILAHY